MAKHHCRKKLVRLTLSWYDSGKDMKEFQITLLDAMVIFKEVWDDTVSGETIRNCFRHCGFFQPPKLHLQMTKLPASTRNKYRRPRSVCDVVDVDGDLITLVTSRRTLLIRSRRWQNQKMIAEISHHA